MEVKWNQDACINRPGGHIVIEVVRLHTPSGRNFSYVS